MAALTDKQIKKKLQKHQKRMQRMERNIKSMLEDVRSEGFADELCVSQDALGKIETVLSDAETAVLDAHKVMNEVADTSTRDTVTAFGRKGPP